MTKKSFNKKTEMKTKEGNRKQQKVEYNHMWLWVLVLMCLVMGDGCLCSVLMCLVLGAWPVCLVSVLSAFDG